MTPMYSDNLRGHLQPPTAHLQHQDPQAAVVPNKVLASGRFSGLGCAAVGAWERPQLNMHSFQLFHHCLSEHISLLADKQAQ